MATAKSPKVAERRLVNPLAEFRSANPLQEKHNRLDFLRDQLKEFERQLDINRVARGRLLYGAVVDKEAKSVADLKRLDEETAQVAVQIEAVKTEQLNIIAEIAGLEEQISQEKRDAAQKAAGQIGDKVSALGAELETQIVALGSDLEHLRKMCGEAQGVLIAAGETEAAAAYAFNAYRRRLSALTVLSLGRIGKLNLNSTVSSEDSRTWSARTGDR